MDINLNRNLFKKLLLVTILFTLVILALMVLVAPNNEGTEGGSSGISNSTDTHTGERGVTPTPTAEPSLQLFHYTDCFSSNSVALDRFIRPSIASQGGFAAFGDGVYLSDLPPTGLLARNEYSLALYNSPFVVNKTTCWLLIRLPLKEVKRVRTVYTDKLPKVRQTAVGSFAIYLRPGQQNLPIDLLDIGRTIYAP